MTYPKLVRSLTLLALLTLLSSIEVGCAKSSEDSPLEASDLVTLEDAKFDANSIMEPAVLEDTQAFDAAAIQRFFERTPYRRPSFLATYQSNGVRASDAIYRAAVANRINPFVMIVRAQALQGLVGTQFYPFPASRVEYAFRCGCSSDTTCDPAQAGFDRQANCLARKLRQNLDAIASGGETAGGWAPGRASTTLDNQKVTPKDASTAALYQENPAVSAGKGDIWLFWNIWQNYAAFLQYIGPTGGGGQGAWIGEACKGDSNCIAPGATCATSFPNGGMCIASCTDGCPSEVGRPESFCADFGEQGGYCLPKCNPSVPGSCRKDYECRAIYQYGSKTVSENVCVRGKG
ncbi:hypothetical protein LZC95_36170 [Pendulispora brunnea]|uniref:Lipoprotein n=1 Tax=Pendulispora brunnea TaxID=2905690 RepID=A0ABZ2JZG3_9BACT